MTTLSPGCSSLCHPLEPCIITASGICPEGRPASPSPRPSPETTVHWCETCARETEWVKKWRNQKVAFHEFSLSRRRLAWVCMTCGKDELQ